MEELLECPQLDLRRNIPAELSCLQDDNTRLKGTNTLLKGLLVVALIVAAISIYQLSKPKEDENRRAKTQPRRSL